MTTHQPIPEDRPIPPAVREHLIERRRTEYPARHGAHYPDFAPRDGRCWSCNADLVNEHYATSVITGCRKCNRSFID